MPESWLNIAMKNASASGVRIAASDRRGGSVGSVSSAFSEAVRIDATSSSSRAASASGLSVRSVARAASASVDDPPARLSR